MKLSILSVMVVLGTAGAAHADGVFGSSDHSDNEPSEPDEFISLGAIPQVGLGFSHSTDDNAFDFSVRGGAVGRVSDHFHVGAFLELHSVGWDTLEAAIGPQVQYQFSKSSTTALQLRAGVG